MTATGKRSWPEVIPDLSGQTLSADQMQVTLLEKKWAAVAELANTTRNNFQAVTDTAGKDLVDKWTALANDAASKRNIDPSAMDIYDVKDIKCKPTLNINRRQVADQPSSQLLAEWNKKCYCPAMNPSKAFPEDCHLGSHLGSKSRRSSTCLARRSLEVIDQSLADVLLQTSHGLLKRTQLPRPRFNSKRNDSSFQSKSMSSFQRRLGTSTKKTKLFPPHLSMMNGQMETETGPVANFKPIRSRMGAPRTTPIPVTSTIPAMPTTLMTTHRQKSFFFLYHRVSQTANGKRGQYLDKWPELRYNSESVKQTRRSMRFEILSAISHLSSGRKSGLPEAKQHQRGHGIACIK